MYLLSDFVKDGFHVELIVDLDDVSFVGDSRVEDEIVFHGESHLVDSAFFKGDGVF